MITWKYYTKLCTMHW